MLCLLSLVFPSLSMLTLKNLGYMERLKSITPVPIFPLGMVPIQHLIDYWLYSRELQILIVKSALINR